MVKIPTDLEVTLDYFELSLAFYPTYIVAHIRSFERNYVEIKLQTSSMV